MSLGLALWEIGWGDLPIWVSVCFADKWKSFRELDDGGPGLIVFIYIYFNHGAKYFCKSGLGANLFQTRFWYPAILVQSI